MTRRIGYKTGAWSTAATWGQATSSPQIHATTNISISTSSYYSATFTAPNTTNACVGFIIAVTTRPAGSGTISFTLEENTVATAAVQTLNASDFVNYSSQANTFPATASPAFIFVKFDTPYVFTSTTAGYYRLKITRSGTFTSGAACAADSGGTLVYAVPVDDRAVVPVLGDQTWIIGNNLVNTTTVTMDGTRACGSSADINDTVYRLQHRHDLGIYEGGKLLWDTTQSSTLTVDGHTIVGMGGEFEIGNSTTAYPTAYTAKFILTQAASGDHGIWFYWGATVSIYGRTLAYWKTDLASGTGTVADPLLTDDAVNWTVNDRCIITATSDSATNYNEAETFLIKTKNTASSYVITSLVQYPNPDFNRLGGGGADVFAEVTETAGTGGTISQETSSVPTGYTTAAKLVRGTADGSVYQNSIVESSTTYDVTFWTRGDGTYGGRYLFYDVTNSASIGSNTATGVTGTTWTQVTTTVTTPATCKSLRIYFYNPSTNGGTAYFTGLVVSKEGFQYTHNTNAHIYNIQRNVEFNCGGDYSKGGYIDIDDLPLLSNLTTIKQNIQWAKFKEFGASTTGKNAVYLGSASAKCWHTFDYNVCENQGYGGYYFSTSKSAITYTGLIVCNQRSAGAYTYYFTGSANKTLDDMVSISNQRSSLFSSATACTFNRAIINANSISLSATYPGIVVSGGVNYLFENLEINCCGYGAIYWQGGVDTKINNGVIGAYGKNGANYGDVYVQTDGSATAIYNNCLFGSDSFIGNYLNGLDSAMISFHTLNGTTNNHAWYTSNGVGRSTGAGLVDETVRTAGGLALRLAPENSSNGSMKWEFDVPTGNIQNKDMMIGIWVYINSANYWAGTTFTLPKMTITYDDGTDVTATAAQVAGSWQYIFAPFTPTTTTPKVSVKVEVLTDATSTDSYVYFDDMSVLYPAGYIMNLGSLDTWSDGQPLAPPISTLFSAQDVWAVSSTGMGTGTIGKTVVDTEVRQDDLSILRGVI